MQAVQRVQELESLNKALRADLLQQYHTVAGMRESMMSLAQRLLEAEVQRDTIVAMHESSAGDPSTPSPDIEAVSSVSVVEAQRRRIHELEMQV